MGLDKDLLIGKGDGIVSVVTSCLGVEREAHVCPECNAACVESHTHNPATAAFDGGACPSWYCEGCQTHYVREADDRQHGMDLYGRGSPE